MKSPECRSSGLWVLLSIGVPLAAGEGFVIPATDPSLAFGALAIHRSGLEAGLREPQQNLVFRKADI